MILPGDTAQPEVWTALGESLVEHKVRQAVVDAGYNTSMVHAFCAPRRWAAPGKGIPGTARPLVEDEKRRIARLRRRVKHQPNAVEPIGVDQGKALIYARLKMEKPGPGYIHLPREASFDDEYFAQLRGRETCHEGAGAGQAVFRYGWRSVPVMRLWIAWFTPLPLCGCFAWVSPCHLHPPGPNKKACRSARPAPNAPSVAPCHLDNQTRRIQP